MTEYAGEKPISDADLIRWAAEVCGYPAFEQHFESPATVNLIPYNKPNAAVIDALACALFRKWVAVDSVGLTFKQRDLFTTWPNKINESGLAAIRAIYDEGSLNEVA